MKKRLLYGGFVLLACIAQAQTVTIPDPNFKAALIADGVDLNKDSQIQVSEAQATKSLNVSSKTISNLTGIEAFTALDSLDCSFNLLTTLNLSMNTVLTYLDCSQNSLPSVDVSSNTALTTLYCRNAKMKTIDVGSNVSLMFLDCSFNQLVSVGLSTNASLLSLVCNSNQLTSLDVSANSSLAILSCYSNPSLAQICISTDQLADTTVWNTLKDATTQWNASCVPTGLDDNFLEPASKKLVGVYTPLGQAIRKEDALNGLYIYQYSDGSTRKVMKHDQ
jgi:hypothetical protein